MRELYPIDQPIYRYWQAFYLALYSRRFYVDVLKRWRGFGLGYFWLLILIATLPLSLRVVLVFNQYFDDQLTATLHQLPDIYIQNGKITLDKPMPFVIRNKQKDVVAVVDSTADHRQMFEFYPKLMLLLNDNHIYFKMPNLQLFRPIDKASSPDRVYINTLDKDNNSFFNADDWFESSGLSRLKWLTDLMVFPALTLFFFTIYCFLMLGVIFMSMGYSAVIFKLKLKFKEAARLCFTALTAQVIVFFSMLTLGVHVAHAATFYVVLFVLYFSFAALAVRKETKQLAHA